MSSAEPGFERKETIATGTMAAAAGGFTLGDGHANTNPEADNPAAMHYVKNKGEQEGHVHVYPIGAITKGSQGKELAEMASMVEAGAVAFPTTDVRWRTVESCALLWNIA